VGTVLRTVPGVTRKVFYKAISAASCGSISAVVMAVFYRPSRMEVCTTFRAPIRYPTCAETRKLVVTAIRTGNSDAVCGGTSDATFEATVVV
jgi:hypothetical protein